MKKIIILFILSMFKSISLAQSDYEIGIIPEINIAASIADLWVLDIELAPRFETASGSFGDVPESSSCFALLDITSVVNRTVGVDAKVGLGYLARLQENKVIHRFIQQYAFSNPYFGYRLGHRFRIDETINNTEKIKVRLRYKLSSDISLNGEFIDPKEVYLKVSNEYVASFQGATNDLEIRLVPMLGYAVNDNHKIELGIDYRIDSFLRTTAAHRFWLSAAYYLSI